MTLPEKSELTDLFMLEEIKGFGPQKFKEVYEAGILPSALLSSGREFQRFGKRGIGFRDQLKNDRAAIRERAAKRAAKQLDAARRVGGSILTYSDSNYPPLLFASNLPVPVLYVRGDLSVLTKRKAVACVGSREIRTPYSDAHRDFASEAVRTGFVITSGFATGADSIGHLAAERSGGETICVMPSGLDRPFPPENRQIWDRFLEKRGAVFASEFGFGVGANALNLRKRNKMIVALARGVLVSQSSDTGGAMNAYRFAQEQKKPVATFMSDGSSGASGNLLIAGSAPGVRMSVLPLHDKASWVRWLNEL